ncbi:MAG: J domain-containing protein [Nanoarchaeota archaeon]
MQVLNIKGHEFAAPVVKDSFSRRAMHFKNMIITSLKQLGINADQVDVELQGIASRKVAASASWFRDGHRMHYSYNGAKSYAENLSVVWTVIALEVNDVISGKKSIQDFTGEFSEDEDVEKKRKAARETLGVKEDSLDLDEIDQKYKALAKKHHPDRPDGNAEEFKRVNEAHKILKRELQ